MDWTQIIEKSLPTIIGGGIVAILTGIGTILYRNRSGIKLFFQRLRLRVSPLDFNIAFALDFNEGLNSGEYYKQIKKNFLKLLEDTNLSNQIKVIDFSDIYLFKGKKEAERFRSEKGIDLIIWGGFTNDKLKLNNEYVNKINLNLTFGFNLDALKYATPMVLLDIRSKMALKNYWTIYESESLRDVDIISNNIFDISTYILALILKIYGRLKKSLYLFENLYVDLKRRNDTFTKEIIPHLINCYDLLSLENGLDSKDLNYAIKCCKNIIAIDSKNLNALGNLALFQYKNGDKVSAENNVAILKKLYPNNPVTIVDVAFFRILQKNFDRALKGYKKLLECPGLNFNPQQLIEFLYSQYEELKEPAILFAIGFLSCHYGDMILGKTELKLFLKTSKKSSYEHMRREANHLMKLRHIR